MIKKIDGFTLVETLVAINLSFLALTFMMSAYLFSQKFISSYIKKLDEKYNIQIFLDHLDRTLNSSDSFQIKLNDRTTTFLINDNELLLIQESGITLLNYDEIHGIEYSELQIKMDENESLSVINGKPIKSLKFNIEGIKQISSNSLNEINMKFRINSKDYKYRFINPGIAIQQFDNIGFE
ncbi:hypothetical protein ACFLSH_02895 [Bacteroidota bacterium]